ncbi:hypothetical protein OH76DRAFT_313372 [Lentinus brumalis]|uniref:Uncharacterized protein n=1 Tax=Lentinus brumalis TaxID=2498619 RepID=A0A371CK23_9APHY|nr:hypothetical protein OH76DRAFT_313372 [Polyporus brumalis]
MPVTDGTQTSLVNLPATLNDAETCVGSNKNICPQVNGVATGYVDEEPNPLPPFELYERVSPSILEGQLLATPLHPYPLIPIVCIADELNIRSLLHSALFQKRAVGHDLPVIGIRHPTADHQSCQVLFAWLDYSATGSRVKPSVL